jgi:alpha-L-rhamnosidase|uniref:alpha-L-rhamnosidase-related protein n=1 Tax=Cephaloticoccus sp. TaxID=1985742 RepID=UPI0040497D20
MNSAPSFLRAKPVWSATLTGQMNIWLSFHARLEFMPKQHGLLRVAAAQAYRVRANGVVVARGPARTAHGFARIDEWPIGGDVSGVLELVIEVMGYGAPTFCSTNEPAFLCTELVVAGKPVVWTAVKGGGLTAEHRTERVQNVERYSYQRAFVEAYRLGKYGQIWQGPAYNPMTPHALALVKHRRQWLERGVALTDLSELAALRPAVRGTTTSDAKLIKLAPKWNHLFDVPKTSAGWPLDQVAWPLFKTLAAARFKTTANVKLTPRTPIFLKAKEWLRVDFGADHTGFPQMRTEVSKPTRLLLIFDEILVDDQLMFNRSGCVNALWLELVPGMRIDFEAFEPYTFRYLQVLVWSGAAEVSQFGLRHYRNAQPLRKAPRSINRPAALVRAAALSSFRQNALDVFMDCPARERAGWLCDSLFAARAEWHLCGDNPIERAFLENYLRPAKFADLPAGMVAMCYPAETLNKQFIPNWAMFLVLELDETRRKRRLPAEWQPMIERRVRGLVRYFKRFENELGLLEKLESWVFVEWSKANEFVQDVNFPSNMLYAATLRSAARLLGEPALAKQARTIEATIRKLAWRDGRFVDNAVRDAAGKLNVTDHASEVCQYYAFYFGITSPRKQPALWRRLVKADYGALYPANVFVGKIMRLDLLITHGEYAAARREILRSYLSMAKLTGTLWELFEKNVSCNHGFTAYIAVLIDRLEKLQGKS